MLTLVVSKLDGEEEFLAECRELEISSQGATLEEAFDNIKEAVALYLDAIDEEGERDSVFADLKIQVRRDKPADHLGAISDVPYGSFASIQFTRIPTATTHAA